MDICSHRGIRKRRVLAGNWLVIHFAIEGRDSSLTSLARKALEMAKVIELIVFFLGMCNYISSCPLRKADII